MDTPIMQRLRAETRAQHLATEAIPFSTAILDGSLPRSAYAGQLAAYIRVGRILAACRRRRSPWPSDPRDP